MKQPPRVLDAADLHPFLGLDVPTVLDLRAAAAPEQPFIVWAPQAEAPRIISYAAFRERVRSLSAGLHAQGLRRGDRLTLHMDNCPEFLETWHACARLGVVAVTTNTRASADELGYFIAHSRSKAVITQPSLLGVVASASGSARVWCLSRDPDGTAMLDTSTQAQPLESCHADPSGEPARQIDPLAACSVQYTSGTTARPKGVVWTHANALWAGSVTGSHLGLTARDIGLAYMPLFHANAMGYSHLATLWAGATLVLMPKFSASRFWPLAISQQCTWAAMIPFAVKALQSLSDPATPHSFRIWGGAYADPVIEARWHIRSIGWWGMTETISQCIVGRPLLPNTPGGMGSAAPEYEIDVRTPANTPVAEGETGRLRVRGVRGLSLFAEYLDDPAATAAAFDEQGWLITGDLVTRIAGGQFAFTDREKDMLKVGGENVASSEIERVILGVPGVAEVAVVSRPHPMLDEVPIACVIASQPDAADLSARILAACAQKLATFKQPRAVHFMQEFPRAAINKIDKAALRRQLAQHLQ